MNTIWGNIFKLKQKEEDEICSVLRKVPMFEDLDARELGQIERILHRREYRSEETIFLQGDPGLGMYIIEEGSVDIVSEPSKQVLAELEAGEFFGELALLDESPRTATAVAKTPCRMLCFFRPDLLDLIERSPRLGVKILFRLARILGERLKKTNLQMHELNKGQ